MMTEIFKGLLKIFSSKAFILAVILIEVAALIFLFTSNGIFSVSSDKTETAAGKKPDLDSAIHAVTNEISEVIGEAVNKVNQSPTPAPESHTQPSIATDSEAHTQSSGNTTGAGFPSRFIIPKLGINTSVEHVGLDNTGGMDVPKSFSTVGWYKLGYKVGDNGSAVVSGHYDNYFGGPAVFWNISKLAPGDVISVIDKAGVNHSFKVTDKKVYAFDKFPLKEVFGTAGASGLNLITCSGEWNKTTKNYSTRTVVYAIKN
jgi:sortase (surface protein transpeptidase)